jgi:hypothetical protein
MKPQPQLAIVPPGSLAPPLKAAFDRAVALRGDGTFVQAAALAPEMFDWYQRDMPNHLPKYQKMITIKLLENEADGTPVMH